MEAQHQPRSTTLFIVIFSLVWVYILNLLCTHGLKWLAWVSVLLPFIILAVALGTGIIMALMGRKKR
jgi:amino acid transporter